MCDTAVAALSGALWIAKNSDREPDEVQVVEYVEGARHPAAAVLRATHMEVPQVRATHAAVVSRPRWMWGCEMGVNARGVAVANEAVFTRVPLAARGLTGMDLQRLALERASSAAEALAILVDLLTRHPQGGRMGFTGSMRYSSSFVLADRGEAWVLETAGELWAAQRVHGLRTISNALSIEADFDRIHPRAFEVARARGWCRGAADFGFARCFGRRDYRVLTGGEARRACTLRRLAAAEVLDAAAMAAVLRDHAGMQPADGLRMAMPCAHASWLPTRASGQTTASMIACLDAAGPRAWFTGTSSPCLGVFKPVHLGGDALAGLPVAGDAPDRESLWWRHERLHRAVLADYPARRAAFAAPRAALEARAWAVDPADAAAVAAIWEEHRLALPGWTAAAASVGRPGARPFHRWWARKSRQALARGSPPT